LKNKQVSKAWLRGVGGPELLDILSQWRPQLKGKLSQVPLPKGSSVGALLVRELLLKAQDRWEHPYSEEQLCHCRCVSTKVVDSAILTGAHSPIQVSKQTSASTACGACRSDVEAIIAYRLKGK